MLFEANADRRFLSPFLALRGIQAEFERLLGEADPSRSNTMAFALYTRDDGLLLRTPLPGVAPENLALEVDGNALTLAGRFEDEPEGDQALAQHLERLRGSFSRTLRLPFEVDAARVEAKLERGVLEVTLPRLQKNPPVKIKVLPQGGAEKQ
jgi:HSP20 family protein